MRISMFLAVIAGLFAGATSTSATQPAPSPPPAAPAPMKQAPTTSLPVAPAPSTPAPVIAVVETEQLVELGKSVAAIRYESDNVFHFAERAAALRELARSLEGGQVEFAAKVLRVTQVEVLIEVAPAGKTRLVLKHAALPEFGNLRTVTYPGPVSTRRLHLFSAPVGLRIGSELPFEMAKKLRHRDTLVIRGTIDSLPVWIESVFAPDAVALISDWHIVDVNPQPSY